MNQKIQCLIDGGFISINDVLEHAQDYMDACDQLDDEQIDKYGSYDAEERRLIDEMYTQEDMYSELVNDDEYGDWECGAGTLHSASMQECDCFKYEEDHIPELPEDTRSSKPEYVIASTAYYMEETYVFEANEQGEITNFGEYGGIALRFGDVDWTNKALAVETTFGEGKYEFVKGIDRVAKADHHLFKRLHEEPEYPLPSDTYDGGISDEK
jgi:hypothetical protein